MNTCNNSSNKLVLGFDFGSKYIGVAIGQTMTNTSRPITCLNVKNKIINWQDIDLLIKSWMPSDLIVGIPVDMQGKEQHTTLECLKFLELLKKRYNLPTHKVDERLSTWEAKKNLNSLQKTTFTKKELNTINATAAAILVQQWLNSQ